jgi:YidC/Oxa1 family membrane protein insertase
MDRTSIIVIVVCFGLIGLWTFVLVPKFYPAKPLPPRPTNAPAASLTTTNPQIVSPPPVPTLEAPAPVTLSANTNVPEQIIELTNVNAHYTFSSYGGGLKEIELLKYPESVSTLRRKETGIHKVATLNTAAGVPTMALVDSAALWGDGNFELSETADGVRASKTLTNGLRIIKEFKPSTNYLFEATVRLENHSAQPLTLPSQEWVVGTATPLGPRDNGRAVGVLWYDGSKTVDVGGSSYFATSGCSQRVPPKEYQGGQSNVVWVAAHNQFFALAAMPQQPAERVEVYRIPLPRPTGEAARLVAVNAPPPTGYQASLVYAPVVLAPNQTLERRVDFYAGPKEYQGLVRIADRFSNSLDLIMSFGWAALVSKALLLGMNWLHEVTHIPYGWAIIVITVIIKVVFWPLTQASTRSMKRMQALQPQMKAIQEKYKDDPVKMNRKTMEFMKEHKVSPLGGCLPMLLQIPVFFGFYQMIQSAIELRGAHFLWVGDLSQADTLFVIPGLDFLPFIGIAGVGVPFNLLPLVMGATMLWQAHLTPPSPGMDPMQAKLMRYMPLMFMLFLYNFSAGLTLYWTVQNLLTIAQTKLTRMTPETPAAPKGPVLTPPPKKRK